MPVCSPITLQVEALQQGDPGTSASCEICKICRETFYIKHLQSTTSKNEKGIKLSSISGIGENIKAYEKKMSVDAFELSVTSSKEKLAHDQCLESFVGEVN